MRFHIITLFPEVFAYLNHSIIGRAQERGVIDVAIYNLRDHTDDKHRTTDDEPYGGGPGMVMKAEPIIRAVDFIRENAPDAKILLPAAGARQFTNEDAQQYAEAHEDIIIIAGHYEGVDERVSKALGAEKIAIGPYTLTGGELPAMIIVDAVSRHVPGVLGKEESIEEKRTASHEVYTRPEAFEYKGKHYEVPEVLLSGNHAEIEKWRKERGRE